MMPQTVPTESTGPVRRRRRYATSNLTRLLCAGARLDPVFAKQVVDVLLKNRERFAAPAYGYDAVPVLAHALATRALGRARTAAVILGFIVTAQMSGRGCSLDSPALLSAMCTGRTSREILDQDSLQWETDVQHLLRTTCCC